jgi:hypothetical protein
MEHRASPRRGVADAELLAESGSGDGARRVLEGLAHDLGKGGWGGVVALDPEAEGLAIGLGERERPGGRGRERRGARW